MVSESYTPQTLKLQIGLFYLFVLGLILSPFYLVSVSVAFFLLILLFLTTLPFSIRAGRRESNIGLVSPSVLILRSVAFSLGLIYGILKSI